MGKPARFGRIVAVANILFHTAGLLGQLMKINCQKTESMAAQIAIIWPTTRQNVDLVQPHAQYLYPYQGRLGPKANRYSNFRREGLSREDYVHDVLPRKL